MHLFDVIWNDPLLRQYYLSGLFIAIPVARIMGRAGFSPFWALLLAVPGFGFALCVLMLALRRWPQKKEA